MSKLTTLLITLACLHTSAAGVAQGITFKGKNVPLEQVFTAIKKQTDYLFFYDYDLVKKAKPVTVEANNMPVKDLLDLCFRDQPVSYLINDKTIIVVRRKVDSVKVAELPVDVTGRVVDEAGEPVAGVVVTLKRVNRSVLTNANGEFAFKELNENDVLVFNSVAYETQEIKVGSRTSMAIALVKKVSELDQTVVIGYGQTTKRFNTGNIGSVKAEEIERQPVNNPLLAMQGRVPGLVITQNNGLPGGGITIRLQGQNSINASNGNDPLIVIDGVPFVSQMLGTTTGGMQGAGVLGSSGGGPSSTGGGNALSYINPADIESIEVLKDAGATAIYGSRGANGVILITTKKGKPGHTKFDVNMQYGFGKVPNKIDFLNTAQYLALRKEAFINDGLPVPSYDPNATTNFDLTLWDSTRYTDWQKVLIGGTANFSNLSATLSGGSEHVQYLVNSSYRKETAVFPGNFNDQRGSVLFSISSTSLNKKLRFQFSGNYLVDKNQLPGRDLTSAILLAPNAPPLYKEDGSLNWELNGSGVSSWDNPVASLNRLFESKTRNLVGSALISYRLLSGLDIKSSFGYTSMQTDEFQAEPISSQRPETLNAFESIGYYTNSNINSWIIEPQLTYEKKMRQGSFEMLIGTTFQQRNSNGIYLNGTGYNNDQVIRDIRAAATVRVVNTVEQVYKYAAVFGRLNYILKDRYIVNLTARRDGSSRFGPKNRFHSFGAVSGAWIFSEERLLRENLNFLSFGKLRGSIGTTGSDQIGDYIYMNLYQPINAAVPYQGALGLTTTTLPNPYIEWEETRKLQFGLDLGFFNNRINATFNYVRNRSSNQLLGYRLPVVTGAGNILDNFDATVQNTALEVMLDAVVIRRKKFEWRSSINVTVPKNKLIAFPDLETSSYSSTLVIGEPLDVRRLFHFMGVDPSTGLFTFADNQGNPTSAPNSLTDRTILLSTMPEIYGGCNNSFQLNGIRLDFFLQYIKQNGSIYMFNNTPMRFLSGRNNQPVTILGRWQKSGDMAGIQKITQGTNQETIRNNYHGSDGGYGNASFLRLKNLSLSYSLNQALIRRIRVQGLRIFLIGQNLLTLTPYKGLDPETESRTSVPPLRIITFGLQITV